MAVSRLAILGTGLIGASIGLGLMARKDRAYEVVGTDWDRGHARAAKRMGAVDRDTGSAVGYCRGGALHRPSSHWCR